MLIGSHRYRQRMHAVPVVIVGTARNTVDKQTWRSGESRASFRAKIDRVAVPADVVQEADGVKAGFVMIVDGDLRFAQGRMRWGQFTLWETDGEIAIRFRRRRGRENDQPLELGTLTPGRCIELATNKRTVEGTKTGRMLYVDEVWRFWWPAQLEAGEHDWPKPDRVIDMRRIMH